MRILLVDDMSLKADHINNLLEQKFSTINIVRSKSYQSALKFLNSEVYDLVLLDMSLPTFDIKPGESGFKFRKLAGIDILRELKRKKNISKVIIVTQWTTFDRDNKIVRLSDLNQEMINMFPENYLGTIFYSSSQTKWEGELEEFVALFKTKNYD